MIIQCFKGISHFVLYYLDANTKLNAIKEEVETLNKKLHELTDEELSQATGGGNLPYAEHVSEATVSVTTVSETTPASRPRPSVKKRK